MFVSQRIGDQKQLAISGDGNTIILSTKENRDETNNKIGSISVYIYNKITNQWEKRGEDILNETVIEGDYELPVNISHDGLKIAIGNSINSFEGNPFFEAGLFRSYIWRLFTHEDENKFHHTSRLQNAEQSLPLIVTESFNTAPEPGKFYWTQWGIDVTEAGNYSKTLALSGDAFTIVVSNALNILDNPLAEANNISILNYDKTTQRWNTIQTLDEGDNRIITTFGNNIQLSSDGSTFVTTYNILAGFFNGAMEIYRKNADNNNWSRLGSARGGHEDLFS